VKRAQIAAANAETMLRRAQAGEVAAGKAGADEMARLVDSLAVAARGQGVAVDPRAIERLPPGVRERTVQIAPGRYALAMEKEGAKAIRTAQKLGNDLDGMIGEYKAIRSRNPHGWITGLGAYEDKGRAGALHSSITTKLKDVLNLGVMSDSDRELLERQIPNIVEWSPTAKYDAMLDQLSTNAATALASVYDAHLIAEAAGPRGTKTRPGQE
jgi:hypothetical protein